MIPAVVLAVAAFVAGKPAAVTCDLPATSAFYGQTVVGSNTVHLRADLCEALAGKPGSPGFATALGAVIHESSHARGVRLEACAAEWSVLTIPYLLERFYGVPMFTRLSWAVQDEVLAQVQASAPQYQFTLDSCS